MDKERKLKILLQKRGYRIVDSDVYNISKRLKEYDRDLVLCFNPYKGRYEVHTCLYILNKALLPTYCISCEKLSCEILNKIKKADNRSTYDFNQKMKDIDASMMKKEKDKARNERELIDSIKDDVKNLLNGKKIYV